MLQRILLLDNYLIGLGVFVIGLSLLEYQIEFRFDDRTKEKNEELLKPLLMLILMGSAAMCVVNIFRKILVHKFYRLRKSYSQKKKSWELKRILGIIIEAGLILVVPLWYFVEEQKPLKFHNAQI
jgi:uncharacterized membrane protein YidH (DUF202 family)